MQNKKFFERKTKTNKLIYSIVSSEYSMCISKIYVNLNSIHKIIAICIYIITLKVNLYTINSIRKII